MHQKPNSSVHAFKLLYLLGYSDAISRRKSSGDRPNIAPRKRNPYVAIDLTCTMSAPLLQVLLSRFSKSVAKCLLFFAKFYRLRNTFHVWKNALECLSKFEKCFRVLCKEFATRFEKWFRVRCTFRKVV